MSIVGTWTFYYSWGCNGVYFQDEVTFNSNGTFADSQGGAGNWSEDPGMMELQYNPPLRTNYSGNVHGNAMVGMSTTFSGFQDAGTPSRKVRRPSRELSVSQRTS
jgi:hypothetical protein